MQPACSRHAEPTAFVFGARRATDVLDNVPPMPTPQSMERGLSATDLGGLWCSTGTYCSKNTCAVACGPGCVLPQSTGDEFRFRACAAGCICWTVTHNCALGLPFLAPIDQRYRSERLPVLSGLGPNQWVLTGKGCREGMGLNVWDRQFSDSAIVFSSCCRLEGCKCLGCIVPFSCACKLMPKWMF